MAEENRYSHYDYQPTPPTPSSQFPSTHTSPHISFSPVGSPVGDSRQSYLYPVYPEQERAATHDEEIQYNENRSTMASTGMDSLTTVVIGDTHKEVVEQRYPYKEMVHLSQPGYQSPELGSHYAPTPEPYMPESYTPQHDYPTVDHRAEESRKKRKLFGCIPVWICVALIIALLLAVGLAVGLYFGLRKKPSNGGGNSNSGSGSNSNSNSNSTNGISKYGVFPGSGFATAQTAGNAGDLLLFFQHSSGEIRKIQRLNEQTWTGGDLTSGVTNDAKNSTPISVVAYTDAAGTPTWHLFYIDAKNVIRDKVTTDNATTWHDGNLVDLNLQAMNDPNAALQACYFQYFSDAQRTKLVSGMHLFFGHDAQTQYQVDYLFSGTTWKQVDEITASGTTGVGCYSWDSTTSIWYGMFLNLNQEVYVAYKDATGNLNNGNWQNTTLLFSDAAANTSMGYTNYFFIQLKTGQLQGYDINFNGANTQLSNANGAPQVEIPNQPIAGSRFAVTKIPSGDLAVFAQDNATNIVENIMSGGVNQWTDVILPIPST